jgi:hypothetical protein
MISEAFRSLAHLPSNLLKEGLASFWARLDPVEIPPRTWSPAPSDNLQRAMNLRMPLKDKTPMGVAQLAAKLAGRMDEVVTGVNNVGNIHFARFDIIDGNLCMLSVYDGDFSNYIRDFIVAMGGFFNMIMEYVEDPPPVPIQQATEEFIEWVDRHDLFQFPSNSVNVGGKLEDMSRTIVLLLHERPNVMLGLYHGYPGFSAAQIRQALGQGW